MNLSKFFAHFDFEKNRLKTLQIQSLRKKSLTLIFDRKHSLKWCALG